MIELKKGRIPEAIILRAANPLDPTTPVGEVLRIGGWGRGSRWVTYNVPGYENIAPENDEFVIVTDPNKEAHVVRMNVNCESLHKTRSRRGR